MSQAFVSGASPDEDPRQGAVRSPLLDSLASQALAQLAERTGLSIGHLSQVERGLSTPTIRQLQAISTGLGVRIGWFFQPDPEPERAAATIVRQFVATMPATYPDRLRRIVLSAADDLFRAAVQ